MLKLRMLIIGCAASLLVACGGGGGGDGGGSSSGQLNVAVTDAPVDGVTEVWVEFTAVTLKPGNDGEDCIDDDDSDDDLDDGSDDQGDDLDNDQGDDSDDDRDGTDCEREAGGQLHYTYDSPRKINLAELVDGKIEILFDEEVPAGRYNWMKLHVNAQLDGVFDSYVVDDTGGQIELRVPPNRLKLGNDFVVTEGGESSFVIDWNLRMGLTNPVGQDGYKLQPSLRITDMGEYGAIEGVVAAGLLPPTNTDCSSDLNTGAGNVVYIYEGANVVPDDIDGNDPDPFATADVRFNDDSGDYEYRVTFLPPGDYTVAFTCQAADDVAPDPEQPDLPVDDAIEFSAPVNAPVVDDMTTTARIQ